MEFNNNFDVKNEKQILNLKFQKYITSFFSVKDRLQRNHSIYRKPPSVFIRSESAHSFDHAEMKKMPTLSSSINDRKQRHFSASNLHDHIKKGEPLFDRSKKAYKFPNLQLQIHPETINITEMTCSEIVGIDVGTSFSLDESFFIKNLESLRCMEVDATRIISLILSNTVSAAEIKVLTEMENDNVPKRDGILFPDFDHKFGSIVFAWACFRGLSHILFRLEASGADINSIHFGDATLVMYAAFSGEIACLKYLIERGANLNYVSPRFCHCALHSAAAGNQPGTAEILLDHDGDLNNVSNDPDMIPLLHHAIRIKSEAVAKLFIKRGADPTHKNLTGVTPLHVACSVQSLKCCELLLEKPGVHVNALNRISRSPLHYAIMATGSNIKIVELLLKHGAVVNFIDRTGFSPLHIAALGEHSECIEMLIRNGADVSATTNKGVSALNIILRKIPESLQAFRSKMNSSIKLRRPGCQDREFEMKFDFTCLFPIDDKPETNFINTFMQENLTEHLRRSLVAFLSLPP